MPLKTMSQPHGLCHFNALKDREVSEASELPANG
jgi:hypothetical protein